MSDKPELIRWQKNKDGELEGYLGDVLWCDFIPEDKDDGITTAAYVYGIAIDGWMLDADTIEQAKPLVDEWTRNWMSRADLAKPSEWISVDDRMPEGESTHNILIHTKEGRTFSCTVFFASHLDDPPTHWQPLPAPPAKTP